MTLQMRDMENPEKGIEPGKEQGRAEGKAQGKAEGVTAMVSAFRELYIADEIILKKIMEKFGMSEEDARKYL